jgi:hypothetical protein
VISKEVRELILKTLDHPEAELIVSRSVHELPPMELSDGKLWANYRLGSLYWMIRVGPKEVEIENSIRAILKHEPITFDKQ